MGAVVPQLHAPKPRAVRVALRAGWQDFRAEPMFGLLVGAAVVLAGWGLAALTLWAGHTFWLILAVFGFPLVAPLCAIGTYEVSRRRERGNAAPVRAVLAQIWAARSGQLPWLSMLIVVALLFWFFLGHMIFALFLGLKPMVNVTSSAAVFLSPQGLAMLGLGTVVGGVFATVLYGLIVLGLPILLERDVDYMSAVLASFGHVLRHKRFFFGWAITILTLLVAAMIPALLGLPIVLPWLGHASWHLYAGMRSAAVP